MEVQKSNQMSNTENKENGGAADSSTNPNSQKQVLFF